jgi:hypothetical protein
LLSEGDRWMEWRNWKVDSSFNFNLRPFKYVLIVTLEYELIFNIFSLEHLLQFLSNYSMGYIKEIWCDHEN